MSNSPGLQPSSASTPSSGLSTSSSTPATEARNKSKSPAVKLPNVFSDDGSFLNRIKRSIKEEEDKNKDQEALERKKNFADRFKNRGKRPPPPQSPPSNSDSTPDVEETPKKKQKMSEKQEKGENSAQAEYQKAIDSYPTSLKDGGTGVRPLVK